MTNWWILIKERFSPWSYVPMILLFTGANALYGLQVTQSSWDTGRFFLVFLLMLSFFFRMRLFDEIKDYEVDLQVNPTRPLARGLLSVLQVKKALFILIIFEVILSAILGQVPLLIHGVAIGYSLLMYEEFFIGDLLRPHLTTYAVTHTFVSTLLGFSSAVAMSGAELTSFSLSHMTFFLMNWAFFNLFEFARKTFAPEEERPHVPSYSNIFGCGRALMLSLSQALVGVGIVSLFYPALSLWLGASIYILLSLPYFLTKNKKSASFFRNISGVYLLVHYILLLLAVRS